MNDFLKKLVLFGVGSVELTRDAVTSLVEDLKKEGALDKEEGKKLVRKAFKDLEKNAKKAEKSVMEELDKLEKKENNLEKTTKTKTRKTKGKLDKK